MRKARFDTMVAFRNLLAKQTSKSTRKPIKTAKEVLMLVDAILYDVISFEHFYTFSDDCDVWVKVDEKNKIVGIKIGEQR